MKKTVLVLLAALSLMLTACAGDSDENISSVKTPDIGVDITEGADGSGALSEISPVSDEDAKKALLNVTGSDVFATPSAIADGVSLYKYALQDGDAFVIKADLSKVSLKATTPYGIKPNGVSQPLASQAENIKAEVYAGINANAFHSATKEPVGIVVTNGKQIYDKGFNDGSICFGITDEGKAFACGYGDYAKLHRNKTSEVVSGTRMTVNNGKLLDSTSDIVASRSAAGFSADRNTVCFVYAENTSCETAASLLLAHGCAVAVEFGYETLTAAMYTADLYRGSSDGICAALFITKKD